MDDAGSLTGSLPVTTAGTLAGWIAGLDYRSLPADIVHQAKICMLDSIACQIGGMQLKPSQVLLDVLGEVAGGKPVSIPGSPARIGLLGAAYLGAQAANALDFDDSFRTGAPCHPGATVVPPGLAVAEARDSGGAALLAAVVAGYEVSLRIGRAVQASPARKADVWGFSPWQAFGAVTTTASLIGLPATTILSALGLTGAQAPVPSIRKFVDGARPFSWIKNAYGIASEVGVLSALLAERGFLGNREIFDGPNGFWIMSGSDRWQPELATEELGGRWMIRDVGFKPYACCRWTHTMVDALKSLAPSLAGRPIERIDVHGFRELTCSLAGDPPDSIIEAQFNARWVAALEASGRSPAKGLHDRDIGDPTVVALAHNVHLHHEPERDEPYFKLGTLPVRVVVTAGGETFAAEAEKPTGSPEAGGFSDADMVAKFIQVVSPVIGEAKTKQALDIVMTLEDRPARALTAALVP
ncbi:MAG: MmgE/PrpD family protein [Alphaproteobacteria bacterium]